MSHDLSGAGWHWWDSGGVCHSWRGPRAGAADTDKLISNVLFQLEKSFYDSFSFFILLADFLQEEGECEVDLELEGEVEGECEAEEAYEEEKEEAQDYPAVIVEEIPSASLAEEQNYSAQVLLYGDEAYIMQEVGNEQEVETDRDPGEAKMFCVTKSVPRSLLCYCISQILNSLSS